MGWSWPVLMVWAGSHALGADCAAQRRGEWPVHSDARLKRAEGTNMTPEEAKQRYAAEWPALNAAKENAATPKEAKRCRQLLSALSVKYAARFGTDDEKQDIADIIAGALRTSRAHAYELMQSALDSRVV